MNCSKSKEGFALPALPHAVMQLLEASMDDDVSMSHLSALASSDPALAAQILRLANSPLYSGGIQVSSISSALIKMGLKAVQCLAVTVSIQNSFSHTAGTDNFSMAEFWTHSILTAICARFIAKKIGFDQPDDAFLAGLLHDIGQLVLLDAYSDQTDGHKPVTVQNIRSGHTVLSAEQRFAGVDHANIGADLLECWRLDPMLADAVRYHHASEREIKDSLVLVKIVHIADRLAHYLANASAVPDDISHQESRQLFADFFDVNPAFFEELTDTYQEQLTEIASVMGVEIAEAGHGHVVEKIRSGERAEKRQVKKHAFDHAVITGCVEKMATAPDPDSLFDQLVQSISLFFDPDTILFANLDSNGRLKGRMARGMKHAHRAHLISISLRGDSIFSEVLEKGLPLHWSEFFTSKEPSALELQVRNFMESPFLVVPVGTVKEKTGVLLLGISQEKWVLVSDEVNILMLLVRQFYAVSQSFHYRKLYDRERRLNAAVITALPMAVLIVNESGKVFFANPAASELLGLSSSQELQEINIWQYLGLDDESRDFFATVSSQGRAQPVTLKFRNERGVFWLRMRGIEMCGAGASGIILVLEDITASYLLDKERRERAELLEKELEKRVRELEEAQRQLVQAERLEGIGEFARQVAHEVNNPLGIIKNFIAILRRELEAGTVDGETLDAIDSEIDRVASIIEELRHFAKYGTPPKQTEEGEGGYVQSAIKAVGLLFDKTFQDKGISLTFEIDEELPPVRMSEENIRQILVNLLKNAQEALESSGKVIVRACIREEKAGRQVVIEVEDNGPGIPSGLEERLFEPFVTTKGKQNSGLGLSVCYGLVKAAGGSMEVESKQGAGARFRVILPVLGDKDY